MGLGTSFGDQIELGRNVLANVLDDQKPLYQLAVNFNWRKLERDWSVYFTERTGRTSKNPRLIAGLMILSYLMRYSDEEVVEQFTQNSYYQFLCGEIYFTRERPCDPSCLSRWRKTLGQEGIEKLLAETIALGIKFEIITEESIERVIVDTTVIEKDIKYPREFDLFERARSQMANFAHIANIVLNDRFKETGPKMPYRVGRLLHQKKREEAQKLVDEQKDNVRSMLEDISRKIDCVVSEVLKTKIKNLCFIVERLLIAEKGSKIYSLHEPDVHVICKGKARNPWEYGCKGSITVTFAECFIVGMKAFEGAPYDGHTLTPALEQVAELSGVTPKVAYVDGGYKGHNHTSATVYISGETSELTDQEKIDLKRRSAVEPIIGHMKSEGRLRRCPLKGILGDQIHALLSATAHNIRKILKKLSSINKSAKLNVPLRC